MSKTLIIDSATAKKIIKELERLENLKTNLLILLPEAVIPYGSKLWWEKEVLKGELVIKKGKFKTYTSSKDLISDLHQGI